MSDVYNRDPENDLTYDSGTGSYVLTSSLLDPDPINESTTVKELAVNSTVYDIVGKGILDQNSKTTQIEWVGTKAEYDALGVYADHCTYIITDDSADSRVDEVGAIAEEVNTLKSYDYVVDWQIPTSANSYTWYRKYKSGWVEQGGQFTATSVADGSGTAGNNIINLPIEMANDRYWYSANIQVGSNGWDYANGVILNARSTTTMTLKAVAGTGTLGLYWEVSGMSA